MPLSMHKASVITLDRAVGAMAKILTKAEAWAESRKIAPDALLNARLALDMFPLLKQVQLISDFAKGTAARLAGLEVPSWPDEEKTFADLQARLAKTRAFLTSIPADTFKDSAARPITIKIRGEELLFSGEDYLHVMALPNFYFHMTTAYAILRHNGMDIGKADFMGRT
ncbi:MAG: DUF1993 domain-containing protein [Beijerinckiaceae bacterium]